jgi:hypothetical protein
VISSSQNFLLQNKESRIKQLICLPTYWLNGRTSLTTADFGMGRRRGKKQGIQREDTTEIMK